MCMRWWHNGCMHPRSRLTAICARSSTIIHEIWQIGDQALLLQLMPWCSKTCPPSNKEFLCAMAAHLRAGDWKENGPWQENRAETPQDQTQDDERQKQKRQAGRRGGPSTGR